MTAAQRQAIHDAMVRLADGDRAAFDTLVERLLPVMLAFAARGVGQAADAEDVAQEVFVRICARIADFDRQRDGLSWAFGIASHEILTHRRRHQRRREVDAAPVLGARADHAASQEDQLLDREMTAALEQAVAALDEDDRRALGLAAGTSDAGIPAATLRKRKQRALDRLRGIWRSVHGEP